MKTKVINTIFRGIDLKKAKNGVNPTPAPTNTQCCLKIADWQGAPKGPLILIDGIRKFFFFIKVSLN